MPKVPMRMESVDEAVEIETLARGNCSTTGAHGEPIDELANIAGGLDASGDRPQGVAGLNDHLDRCRRGVGAGTDRVGGYSGRHRPGGGSVGAEEIEHSEDSEGNEQGEKETTSDSGDRPAGSGDASGTGGGLVAERGDKTELWTTGPFGLEIPGGWGG